MFQILDSAKSSDSEEAGRTQTDLNLAEVHLGYMSSATSLNFQRRMAHRFSRITDKPTLIVLLISFLGVISLWPFSGGEDVANARQNILNGERTDFWGGFSQYFYSIGGLGEPVWHITIGLIHALLVLLGTIVTIRNCRGQETSKARLIPVFFLHYLATIYVLDLSRDATLLSFIWLGFALLLRFVDSSNFSPLSFCLTLALILIGFSFRPWLAIAFVPLVFAVINLSRLKWVNVRKFLAFAFSFVAISVGPFALDATSKNLMGLEESYPEQQVMILDIASMACLSADKQTHSEALNALTPISTSLFLTRERLCGQFYPQNWGSLTFYSNPSDPVLRMVAVNDRSTYELLRRSWIQLLRSQPVDYFQIKVFQFSQLLISGDSIRLAPKSPQHFFLIPYETVKALRLLSCAPVLILLFWLTFSSRFKAKVEFSYTLVISYLLTVGIVTVAFIGDNQRYISWLALIVLFSYFSAACREEAREST